MMHISLHSKFYILIGLTLSICLLIASCTNDNIPRQKAHQRVYLPKKEYKPYQSLCPFQFEIPIYSEIEDKTTFNGQKLTEDTCWFNIVFPDLNGHFPNESEYNYDQKILGE